MKWLRRVRRTPRDADILVRQALRSVLEGDLEAIFAAIVKVHETLHAEGSVRLVSYLKLETRTDKTPTLAGKRL